MVDYLSRYRLYNLGYISPSPRAAVPTHSLLFHESNRRLYRKTGDRQAHDCRPEFVKDMTDRRDFEAKLLSRGLRDTYEHNKSLHSKPVAGLKQKRAPEKMLLRTGELGTQSGQFHYPRGLVATDNCDIVVADSQNDRIQILNQMGVYKSKFGTKGSEPGEFNEPVDVCQLPNGDLVVADRRNKRVQVFTEGGMFKYLFSSEQEPYSVSCDKFFNIVVSTTARTIEVFTRVGKPLNKFRIGGKTMSCCPVQICCNNMDEVIVCDPVDAFIKYFTYDGKMLYKFQPQSTGEKLSVMPAGICMNALGEILLSDSLNHTVNLYSERGNIQQQIISPVDDAGTIHSISMGPEGHLVATEFSVRGEHCVKIFRYLNCECHQTRPPSSRRRTPIHFMDL